MFNKNLILSTGGHNFISTVDRLLLLSGNMYEVKAVEDGTYNIDYIKLTNGVLTVGVHFKDITGEAWINFDEVTIFRNDNIELYEAILGELEAMPFINHLLEHTSDRIGGSYMIKRENLIKLGAKAIRNEVEMEINEYAGVTPTKYSVVAIDVNSKDNSIILSVEFNDSEEDNLKRFTRISIYQCTNPRTYKDVLAELDNIEELNTRTFRY